MVLIPSAFLAFGTRDSRRRFRRFYITHTHSNKPYRLKDRKEIKYFLHQSIFYDLVNIALLHILELGFGKLAFDDRLE